MLTFNDLLTLQGVDPAQVRLVRHQDRRLRAGRLYEAWRNDRAAFEAYQSAQVRDVFPIDAVLASFIVTDARKTVFVGMYRVDSVGNCPPGTTDALLHSDVSGQFKYDLQLLDVLSDYRDKLAIEWAPGTRVWVQRAANQAKPVIEIAEQYEPKFPVTVTGMSESEAPCRRSQRGTCLGTAIHPSRGARRVTTPQWLAHFAAHRRSHHNPALQS